MLILVHDIELRACVQKVWDKIETEQYKLRSRTYSVLTHRNR